MLMTKLEETEPLLRSSAEMLRSSREIPIVVLSGTERKKTEIRREFSAWRKIIILTVLTYANFWCSACFSLQAPFFPQEAEKKGATPTQYGFIISIFELAIMIMSPVYGKLMLKITPKHLMIAGTVLEGAACVVFGLLDRVPAGTPYIVTAFIIRIIEGCGGSALVTCTYAITAAEFPNSIATTFSVLETTFGVGYIIGPTIGGALYQAGGFLLPFVLCGGFLILGAILLIIFLPPNEEVPQQESQNIWAFILDFSIITNTFAIVTAMLLMGFNCATLEPHIRKFNLAPVALGSIFIITASIYAFTTPLWGRLCDKGVDPYLVTLAGYLLTCIGLLFIGPVPFIPITPKLWIVIVSLLAIGLGLAAKLVASFIAALKETIARGFPDNFATYGMVSALFATSCSIGAFIGPSLGGFLLEYIGYEMGTVVLFALEVFFTLSLIVYLFMKKVHPASISSERIPILQQKAQIKTQNTDI